MLATICHVYKNYYEMINYLHVIATVTQTWYQKDDSEADPERVELRKETNITMYEDVNQEYCRYTVRHQSKLCALCHYTHICFVNYCCSTSTSTNSITAFQVHIVVL